MKRFACGDVVPGCVMLFEEASVQEMLAEIANHACEDHGIAVIDDETIQRVIERIYEVKVPLEQRFDVGASMGRLEL